MSGRLSGKVAVVTGAGGAPGALLGVGGAIAIAFAREGASVGVLDLDAARADHTVAAIKAIGGAAIRLQADVTRHADCEAALDEAVAAFGGLSILVNNAALYANPNISDDEAAVQRLFAVNVLGPMHMTEAAAAHLKREAGGCVLNIASIAGLRGFHGPTYSATKGGLIAYTRTMAHLLGQDGIRVNCVAPGHIVAPQSANADEKIRAVLRRSNLLDTDGTAEDVAMAALFLASDEARWVTGVTLPVDGGVTATTASGMASALRALPA